MEIVAASPAPQVVSDRVGIYVVDSWVSYRPHPGSRMLAHEATHLCRVEWVLKKSDKYKKIEERKGLGAPDKR